MTVRDALVWLVLFAFVAQFVWMIIIEAELKRILSEIKEVTDTSGFSSIPPKGIFSFSRKILWLRKNRVLFPQLLQGRVGCLLWSYSVCICCMVLLCAVVFWLGAT